MQFDTDRSGIFINGIETGFTTPHTFPDQNIGDYAVNVTLTGYFPSETLTRPVARDTETVFDFTLTKIPSDTGSITVNSIPTGAGIFINGIETGFTHAPYIPRPEHRGLCRERNPHRLLPVRNPDQAGRSGIRKPSSISHSPKIPSDTGSITVNSIPTEQGSSSMASKPGSLRPIHSPTRTSGTMP